MGNLIDGSGCGKGGRTVERLTYGKKYEFLRYSPQISQFPPLRETSQAARQKRGVVKLFREQVNGIAFIESW
jgi:hypothetical protein